MSRDSEPDAAATKVTFTSTNTGTATVSPATAAADKQVLTVTGVARGTTDIQAKFDGTNAEKLNVSVKKKTTLRVTFNYVSDNAGHGTIRGHAEANNLLARLNEIYGPQTNMEFVLNQVRDVQVSQNLGDKVDKIGCTPGVTACEFLSPEIVAITSLADSTADRNIFFIREIERKPPTPSIDVAAIGENPGSIMLVEDRLGGDFGQVVSHEMGHNFGLGHYTNMNEMHYLMYYTTSGGCFIPKSEADKINP